MLLTSKPEQGGVLPSNRTSSDTHSPVVEETAVLERRIEPATASVIAAVAMTGDNTNKPDSKICAPKANQADIVALYQACYS